MTDPQHESAACLPFERAFEAAAAQLRDKLRASPPAIRKYTEHLLKSQGKLIRTRCVLAAAMRPDGLVPVGSAEFACAVELVHLASLVHDDVIDDAPLRRGNPTLQKKFGKKEAVICGDWLLCLALKTASVVQESQRFAVPSLINCAARLCLGELTQQEHNGDFNLSYYRYFAIISGKTAALFEAAFFCGAVLSAAEQKQKNALIRFGKYLGLAFQLLDDCIDYEQDESNAGKPVMSDFAHGVITMPLIYALNSRQDLKNTISNSTPEEVVNQVKKIGGVTFTKKIALACCRKAFAALESGGFTEFKKACLTGILEQVGMTS